MSKSGSEEGGMSELYQSALHYILSIQTIRIRHTTLSMS